MMSPRWLMLYPGLTLIGIGVAAQLAILRGPMIIAGVALLGWAYRARMPSGNFATAT